MYVSGEIDRVELIYHHFKSMGVQILLRETYLPIDLTRVVDEEEKQKEEEVQGGEIANDYIIEPSAEELIANLIPTVLSQKLLRLPWIRTLRNMRHAHWRCRWLRTMRTN